MTTIRVLISDDSAEEIMSFKNFLRTSQDHIKSEYELNIIISKGCAQVLNEIKRYKPHIVVIEAFYPSFDENVNFTSQKDIMESSGYMLDHKNENALLPKINIKAPGTQVIVYTKYRGGPAQMVLDALSFNAFNLIDKGICPPGVIRPLAKYYEDSHPLGEEMLLKTIIEAYEKHY